MKIGYFDCNEECKTSQNQTFSKNPYLIEIKFLHNISKILSMDVKFYFKEISSKSTEYKIIFVSNLKTSNFELSGPKGYILHKPIILRQNETLEYFKLPFTNEKVLFGENILINEVFKMKSNKCDEFYNFTLEYFTKLKFSNFSELGAPKNISKFWNVLDVNLQEMGANCKNFSNEFYFNFEFARMEIDGIRHQNILKNISITSGNLKNLEVLSLNNEIRFRIGVMFFDLTDISRKSGQNSIRITFEFIIFITLCNIFI